MPLNNISMILENVGQSDTDAYIREVHGAFSISIGNLALFFQISAFSISTANLAAFIEKVLCT